MDGGFNLCESGGELPRSFYLLGEGLDEVLLL
jgi:hypothetical protein